MGVLPAMADGAMDEQLGKLEEKFFSQTYKSDTTEKRVGRLEDMLFGHPVNGPVDQRFNTINNALNSIKKENRPQFSEESAPSDERPVGPRRRAAPASIQPMDAAGYQPQTGFDQGGDNGPQTPVKRPSARAQASDDQDDDAVTTARSRRKPVRRHSDWDESDGMNETSSEMQDGDDGMIGVGMPRGGSPSSIPGYSPRPARPANLTMTDKLSRMEKKVFGKANSKQPLIERVKRLEHEVLPNDKEASQQALPDRVAKLWSAVAPKSIQSGGVQFPESEDQLSSAEPNMGMGSSMSYNSGSPAILPQSSETINKPSLLHRIGQAIGQAATGMMSGMNNPYYGYGSPYGLSGVPPYGYSPYGFSPYGTGGISPYGFSPYGLGAGISPYGMSPYGASPYGINPYGIGGSPFGVGGLGGFSPYGAGGLGGLSPFGIGGINPFGVGNSISSPAPFVPGRGGSGMHF